MSSFSVGVSDEIIHRRIPVGTKTKLLLENFFFVLRVPYDTFSLLNFVLC
jgi:hypothetical protein